MPVEAVKSANTNNRNQTCGVPMAKGAAVGAGTGLVLKYAYPLIKEEKSTDEYISAIKDIENKQNTFGPWMKTFINEIKEKGKLSTAEDIFINTYDGIKEGEPVGGSRILDALHRIEKEKPDEMTELKHLFHKARHQAEMVAKKHIEIYNLATKHIRPTGFFVTTGAIAGAVVALVNHVLKTEINE